MAFYREDIVSIELESGSINRSFLHHTIGSGDQKANRFGVRLFRGGEPVSAESATVTGLFMAPDGTRYVISETSFPGSTGKEGNKVYVQLPPVCYAVTGQFTLAIKLTGGGVEGTMRIIDGTVDETGEDGAVVPTSTIPTTAEIIEAYEEAVAVMGGSVRFDATQSLTSTEKTTARGNIDAAGIAQVVRVDAEQSLTGTQKATARGNIDAAGIAQVVRVDAEQSLTNAQKSTARENIGIEDMFNSYPGLLAMVMERTIYFPNMGSAAYNALEYAFNSTARQYTVTALNNFGAYGFTWSDGLVSIGRGGSRDYPMPESFSSAENVGSTMCFVCFDLTDTAETTWKIVPYSTFVANENLVALCACYEGKATFFSDSVKILFKNSITTDAFLQYENSRTAASVLYYPYLCNATALVNGRAYYYPSEYRIVFTKPVFAPSADVGSFNASKQNDTIEIDWSEEPNPSYLRGIYYDNTNGTIVAICNTNVTENERFANRIKKRALSMICMVYQGTFVYTCGSCTPGKWFVNGNDIYGGASSEFVPDLFKTFKRVGVIGDSLSVGYMYNKTTETATSRMLQYSWVKQVMNDAGVPWLNLGTSGQSVLTWCSSATYGKVQAEASGNKCQAYIIGLGENDQSNTARGVPLGTANDIVDDYTQVATTYYGGYARIIQILKHLNPDCKIFCLTNPRTGGNARAEYNVAVRYIAGTYYTADDNVFLVDLANNDSTLFNGSTFLPVDASTITGGHYSAVGYARIASIIENEISKAIEANQQKFIDVAFVAYDTGDPTPNTMTE